MQVLAHIFKIIPIGIFTQIMATNPKSGIKVEEVREAVYARWRVSRVMAYMYHSFVTNYVN